MDSQITASPALPQGLTCDDKIYLAPAGFETGHPASTTILSGDGWTLAGTDKVFTACYVYWVEKNKVYQTFATFLDILNWSQSQGIEFSEKIAKILQSIARQRSPFASLSINRPRIMGIVNVTPDSFSDGGHYLKQDAAIAHGLNLAEKGASILDIGGESTRPGAESLSPEEEMNRVLPVIENLASRGLIISVDTRHAKVMAAALEKGATIINDITALTGDQDSLKILLQSKASVILMHMQGTPKTMQLSPHYDRVLLDVYDYLQQRVKTCLESGLSPDRLCIDPGIGFGKTAHHNFELIRNLSLFHSLGLCVLLGASRKRFIAEASQNEAVNHRLPGSLAALLSGLDQGVQIFRVHDVAETAQAIAVWEKIYQ
jgi:dihydropteroate synthase